MKGSRESVERRKSRGKEGIKKGEAVEEERAIGRGKDSSRREISRTLCAREGLFETLEERSP